MVTGTGELVNAVILALHAAGVTARDVQLDSSNLEDAFVKLTGKNLHIGRSPGMSHCTVPITGMSLARTATVAFGQVVLQQARLVRRQPRT